MDYIGFNNLHMEWLKHRARLTFCDEWVDVRFGLDLLNDVKHRLCIIGNLSHRRLISVLRERYPSREHRHTFPSLFSLSGGAQLFVSGNFGGSFINPVSVSNFTGTM